MKKEKNLFKVGCNFTEELISVCKKFNEKYSNTAQIVEFFGSDRAHEDLAARPGFRLPEISKEFFVSYIKKCNEAGILFNYTMNSPFPYLSKKELLKHKEEIQEFVLWLESVGVGRITIANPLMALIIREVSNIELEVSTILDIKAVTQLKYYHEKFGINKFCCAVDKNRDLNFLKNCAKYCKENNLLFEVLVNEACSVANKNGHYATACPFRQSCYMCHAGNKTKEDALSYNNYPMGYCMGSRNGEAEGWLKSRMVRPEDLHYYNEIGINYFKISGRTGSTKYLSEVIEAYMSENFEGNFVALWKNLESIYNESQENVNLEDYIPNKKLDGFLDKWFKQNHICADHICNETCTYCKDFYDKHILNS